MSILTWYAGAEGTNVPVKGLVEALVPQNAVSVATVPTTTNSSQDLSPAGKSSPAGGTWTVEWVCRIWPYLTDNFCSFNTNGNHCH